MRIAYCRRRPLRVAGLVRFNVRQRRSGVRFLVRQCGGPSPLPACLCSPLNPIPPPAWRSASPADRARSCTLPWRRRCRGANGRFDGRLFSGFGHHRARAPLCTAVASLLFTLRTPKTKDLGGWPGWHHHMTLAFLRSDQLRFKKSSPASLAMIRPRSPGGADPNGGAMSVVPKEIR